MLTYYSAVDPSFGQRGKVIGPLDKGSGTELSSGSAVAVQSDGKIVEVGLYANPLAFNTGFPKLAVRRYNTDGTLDTTFGTSGQTTIPLPSSSIGVSAAPHNIVIQPNDSITFATTLALTGATALNLTTEGMVVHLTAGGALDTSFASTGEYVMAGSNATANAVTLDLSGDILVLGSRLANSGGQLTLTRLSPAGVADGSFAAAGTLTIPLPASQQGPTTTYTPASLAVTPTGQIYVAGSDTGYYYNRLSSSAGNLTRVNANGTIDTSYGTAGTVVLNRTANNVAGVLQDLALQRDGKVILTGFVEDGFTNQGYLTRVNADGTSDTAFINNVPVYTSPLFNGNEFKSVIVDDAGDIYLGGASVYQTRVTLLKFLPDGTSDRSFGFGGRADFITRTTASQSSTSGDTFGGMILTKGKLVVAGGLTVSDASVNNTGEQNVLMRVLPVATSLLSNDYDGDGVTDIGLLLTDQAVIAYRPSAGGDDFLTGFGMPGAGNTLPEPGDYDGDGQTNLSVYLPTLGQTAHRVISFNGSTDQRFDFGLAGAGASIPAQGDYDGDRITDEAVYLPATGEFSIRPSSSGITLGNIPFGTPGIGASIPAPGDYDGDSKTDLAVYLPALGAFAYRPSGGGKDQIIAFGNPGAQVSIPDPGDYDGDGKTDLAVYISSLAIFGYRPSSGGADVLNYFGASGLGNTIPAPGDYDGDGKFDVAGYLPGQGIFAYRPSSGGNKDVLVSFGIPGNGKSIPLASIPYAQVSTTSGSGSSNGTNSGGGNSNGFGPAAAAYIPLVIDSTDPLTNPKKKSSRV